MAAKTRKFSTLVENQLPSFISSEYQNFSKFVEKYYEHLESRGQAVDVITNITKYADINFYEQNLLKEFTTLTSNISETSSSIQVEDASSFPETNGYIKINNEICFYKSRTDTEFLEVSRGVSGNTSLGDLYSETTFVTTIAEDHYSGDTVVNISNLFLYALVKNFESQYLDAFPEKYLRKEVDKRTLIKNIKKFYSAKGSDTSVKFIFSSIIPENEGNIPELYNPKDYTLKSSTSDWITKYSLKVKVLSGDPFSLVGNQIIQETPSYASAVVDSVVYLGKYAGEDIYELVLSPDTVNSNFKIVSKTKLSKTLQSSAQAGSKINVVSTFGFEKKGSLLINSEVFTFNDSNVTQFTIESRSLSTSYASGTIVYENNTIEAFGVKLIILGCLYNLNVNNGAPYSRQGDKIQISEPGFNTKDPIIYDFVNNAVRWKINQERTSPTISNNAILQNLVSELIADVSAIYEDDQYYYICSSSYPSHSILNSSVTQLIGEQKVLKLIRKNPITVTEVYPTTSRDVGIFVDGTLAFSYKDFDYVNYGIITNIHIKDKGTGYRDKPYILIDNQPNKAEAVMLGEVIESIKVADNQIYQTIPTITITSGRNAVVDAIVTEGRVTSLVIKNPGEYYSTPPIVRISDTAGKGRFAEYKTIVSFDGKIIDFEKIDEGKFYSQDNVVVEIIPVGSGATAEAEIYKWFKNRFKKLESSLDSDYGYVFPNFDEFKPYGYGRLANPLKLRASIGDNLNQSLIEPSTKKHSPILGFAYDGNPIYGPFGYSDPLDPSSSIARMSSGYTLKANRENGPSTSLYPLGTFIDDYKWSPSRNKSILDKNNGRFCVTPEYPNGTYAYFITTNSSNQPVFPYILGENYYSLPVDSNYNSKISQDDLPKNVKRLNSFDLDKNGDNVVAFINDVIPGSISEIDVVSSPESFSTNSNIVFDNSNTEGSGASAKVSSVFGANVENIKSKKTVIKINIIENCYLFDGDFIRQQSTNAVGKVVGNVFNTNTIFLEEVVGTFNNTNKLFAKDSNNNDVKVINILLDQNSSYTKDSTIVLTDGLNNQNSVIATGVILESTSNQNSVKVKIVSGSFVIDQKYQLRSSDLNNTPGSKILEIFKLSENLTPFQISSNLALAKTDSNHRLAIGDKVDISIDPNDSTTETLYYVRKRAYQYATLNSLTFSGKLIDTGIGRLTLLNSGTNYTSGTFTNVELVFLDQSRSRLNVGSIGNANNAKATVVVTGGKIRSVTITSKGKNYKQGDILTILDTRIFKSSNIIKCILMVDHVGISQNETKLFLNTVNNLSNGDKLKIGEEIIEISSVNRNENSISVIRGSENTEKQDHFNNQTIEDYSIKYRFDVNYRPLGVSTNNPFVDSFNNNTNVLTLKYAYSSLSPVPIVLSNVFYDNSTPQKLVSISSVTDIKNKLEFSKTNQSNFVVNPIIDIQKYYSYKFDTSHSSMTGTFLDFSPSTNYNIIVSEKQISNNAPGNSGSFVKIKFGYGELLKSNTFTSRKDTKFNSYYYFTTGNITETDNSYLNLINDPLTGEKDLVYVTNNKFVYEVETEPQYQSSGKIVYTTDSEFAVGKINKIFIDNTGSSYQSVPTIAGVYVSPEKESIVKPIFDPVNNVISSVEVISGGIGYENPVVVVSNYDDSNCKFNVYSENGVIKRVDVVYSDNNFSYLPELKVIEGSVKAYVKSNTIGIPKNVRFVNTGAGFFNDFSILPSYTSSYSLVLKNFNTSFYDGEEIVQTVVQNNQVVELFKSRVCKNGWNNGSNILRLENIVGSIDAKLPIKRKATNQEAFIDEILYTNFVLDVKSFINNQGYYSSDKGKLSSNTQKLTDSYFYQDYSYVIKSKTAIDVWRDLIKQTTHPAGFKLFGELLVESEALVKTPDKQPNSEKVRIINLSPKSIEVIGTKRTVTQSIINVENTHAQRGIGYVSIDEFNNSETLSKPIKLSPSFNGAYDFRTGKILGRKTFTVIDAETNLPLNISSDKELIITIDGVIQEPGKSYTISNSEITFAEPPLGKRVVEGQLVSEQDFYGLSFRFKNSELNSRYLKKIRNIFQRNGIWLDSANQIRFNKQFITEEAIGYAKELYPDIPWTNYEKYVRNDLSYIIDSIEHDLRFGGNSKSLNYSKIYSRQLSSYVDEILNIYDYVSNLCIASIRNWDATFINDGINNQVIITANSDLVEIPSTKGIVAGMYISCGNLFPENTKVIEIISDTIVKLSNPASSRVGVDFIPLNILENTTYTVQPNTTESYGAIEVAGTLNVGLNATITSFASIYSIQQITFYLSKINSGTFYDASNLIEKNKIYIQEETIGWLNNRYPNLNNPNEQKCKRDIGYYVDAFVYNLRYGGNSKILEFGKSYYEKNRLKHIIDQLDESLEAYSYAKDLMILAMRNDLPVGTYTNVSPFEDLSIPIDTIIPTCAQVESTINSYYSIVETILKEGKNIVALQPENQQKSGNWTELKPYTNYNIIQDTPIFNTECQDVVSSIISLFDAIYASFNNQTIQLNAPDFFNGETKEFDLFYEDNTIVKTDLNENLIVLLNGVIQFPGLTNKSYYIKRLEGSNIPDKIVFSEPPKWKQDENALNVQDAISVEKFFAWTVGSYKTYTINENILNFYPQGPFQIVSEDTNKVVTIYDDRYALVFVDGILQKRNESYIINGSTITFNKPLTSYVNESGEKINQKVVIFLLYGRDLQKTATFYDFEPNVYYNNITLTINGTGTFNKFYEWYKKRGQSKNLFAFQNINNIVKIIGKIKGYNLLNNRWELQLLGNNLDYDNQYPFYLTDDLTFTNVSDIDEISDILYVAPNQVYTVSVGAIEYYGQVVVDDTGILQVAGTIISSPSQSKYDSEGEASRLLVRDSSAWIYNTELNNKTWNERAKNYANLLEGDLIKIDGENDYRTILQIPTIVQSKQYNKGESPTNEIYGQAKVTNYNDITRGEGLSITTNISNGSIIKLNWNKRDINLYLKYNILTQPYSYQYFTPPKLQFIPTDGNGGGAKAEVIVAGGQIVDIILLSGGKGYTSPPKVVVSRGYNRIKRSDRRVDTSQILNVYPVLNVGASTNFSSSITYPSNPGVMSMASFASFAFTAEGDESEIGITPFTFGFENNLINVTSFASTVLSSINNTVTNTITTKLNNVTPQKSHLSYVKNIVSNIDSKSVSSIDIPVVTRNIHTKYDNTLNTSLITSSKEIKKYYSVSSTSVSLENTIDSIINSASFLEIDLDINDTIIYVPSTNGFPDSGKLLIGKEIVSYSQKLSDRFLNVIRGVDNTTANSYTAGQYLRAIA